MPDMGQSKHTKQHYTSGVVSISHQRILLRNVQEVFSLALTL
jgi:hypothetical protein